LIAVVLDGLVVLSFLAEPRAVLPIVLRAIIPVILLCYLVAPVGRRQLSRQPLISS
jgi:hypothetical protein